MADWISFAAAGVFAYYWRFNFREGQIDAVYLQLIFGAAFLMVISSSLVYRSWRSSQILAVLGRVGLSWVITWGILMTWLVLTQTADIYSRLLLACWAGASLFLTWFARACIFLAMSALRDIGVNQSRVLLVGSSNSMSSIRRRVKAATWSGFKVVGVCNTENAKLLSDTIESLSPDEIWIFQSPSEAKKILNILDSLRYSTANIRLVPDVEMMQFINHGVTVVLGIPMLNISSTPMGGLNLVIKWLEDKIFATLIIILISPVLAIIAILIKSTSDGPILFIQQRHGWNGESIGIFKFRSMYVQKQDASGFVKQATKNDPRITPLGRILRSTSLDELPQFFNVLQGNMSIVGPRPHAIAHNLEYREHIPRYMLRHKVKPGITGWAQINGLRGETDTLEKMDLRIQADLYYIENWSLWFDIKIIFLTVFKGFLGKNAY